MSEPTRLTDRQRRFAEEYLVDCNATQAAVRAGYSEKTANREGSRLLSNVGIQAAIAAGLEARSRRTEITADYVLQRLKQEAELAGEGSSHAARVAALKLLGQHLALFVERKEVTGRGGAAVKVSYVEVEVVDAPRRLGDGPGAEGAPHDPPRPEAGA